MVGIRSYPQADSQVFRMSRGRQFSRRNGTFFSPDPTYWEKVSCSLTECPEFVNGWVTKIPLHPDQEPEDLQRHRVLYNYIRDHSERGFDEKWEGSTAIFRFPSGQECFSTHRRPVERDPAFIVNGRTVDYDEFFYTFNETTHLLEKRRKNG